MSRKNKPLTGGIPILELLMSQEHKNHVAIKELSVCKPERLGKIFSVTPPWLLHLLGRWGNFPLLSLSCQFKPGSTLADREGLGSDGQSQCRTCGRKGHVEGGLSVMDEQEHGKPLK